MTDPGCPSVAAELVRAGVHNTRRGEPWKSRTHCQHGHEFTPENTTIRSDSSENARRCLACKRERDQRWYQLRGRELRKSRRPVPTTEAGRK